MEMMDGFTIGVDIDRMVVTASTCQSAAGESS